MDELEVTFCKEHFLMTIKPTSVESEHNFSAGFFLTKSCLRDETYE